MRYVSDIISDDFNHVYYSRIEEIFGFSITDDETEETVRYNMQGTENLLTKEFMKEFSETVYGFDLVYGLWLTRPCDLKLYEIIDFEREYIGGQNCLISLEAPNDKTCTLLPNYDRFVGSNPVFTVASIIFERNNFKFCNTNAVIVEGDIIKIQYRASKKVIEYKILDMKKFNILTTKYTTLKR